MDRTSHRATYRTIDRRTFSTTALAFLFNPKLYASQASRPTDTKDINAVYTAVLSARCTCCTDPKQQWVIDDHTYAPTLPILDTKTYTPIEHARLIAANGFLASITPPADRIDDATAALADLKQRLDPPTPIDAHLKLPQPYRLVTPEERHQYFVLNYRGGIYSPELEARAAAVPKPYRREFEHVYGIDSLSPIGFNPTQTLAILSYRTQSSGCTDESWHVLERSAVAWHELKWPSIGNNECT
jgi:hypothetical protein